MAKNYYGITDVGRQRNNNEDAFIAEPVLNGQYLAACVIDGVGGYEGGEVAAAIAQQSIRTYLQIPSGEVLTMMREAMSSANEKIYREKVNNSKLNSMACVATLALIDAQQNKFYYAHVGDTRLYLFRDKSLIKVTKDHSFVGFLEDTGRLTEEAAMQHPKRNEINKALGFEAPLLNPADYIETGESPFLPGDSLLLCSDGLTDLVNAAVITSVLTNADSLEGKCHTLIDAANKAGGKDNITVVLVQHTAKPVKQAATKPAAVKKNAGPQAEPVIQSYRVPAPVTPAMPRQRNTLSGVLAILSVLLLGALVWSLFFRNTDKEVTQPVVASLVPTAQEARLREAINRVTGDTLTFTDSLAVAPIYLTDTLQLDKDTLIIKGNGNVLGRDSSFQNAGASIVIAPTVKYIMFDSIVLQDMIITTEKPYVLHFRNTRFRNSYIQVKQGARYNDSLFTGSLLDMQKATKDSLPTK